jgi:UDP-N-acetylmuramoyl-L-alanyl-D-glutamate--2,6-diaminopimelate ligase
MRLRDLLAAAPAVRAREVLGDDRVAVRAVARDSRAVTPGSLFACVVGAQQDGHDHAAAAVAAGAVALLVERRLSIPVPQVLVGDSRVAVGELAAALLGRPSDSLVVVGVTGTTGKTTTTHLLHAILEHHGWRTALVGTLGGARTTPEAVELQTLLARERDAGTQAVVMEVSSHALALSRVAGTTYRAAVFTNLGTDHLDFHGTPERYFAAKASLFTPGRARVGVVNVGDPHGRLLADAAQIPVVPWTPGDARVVRAGAASLEMDWRGERLAAALGGEFNVANVVAAATTALELGIPVHHIVAGLAAARPVPGRFESVSTAHPFSVVIDYAHTPDALAAVLDAARAAAAPGARVIAVFGCGGNRDASKRPEMGRVAAARADVVILTTDNPRDERAADISAAVRAGTAGGRAVVREIEDRRTAIAAAVAEARPGDVVLVAGKGHERTQTVGYRELPFDDAEVAREVLARAGGAA